MGRLLVEVLAGDAKWNTLGELQQGSEVASLSDRGGAQREVVLFQCCGTHSFVTLAPAGWDYEDSDHRVVEGVSNAGVLACLEAGQSYERDVTPDSPPRRTYRVRWTHFA